MTSMNVREKQPRHVMVLFGDGAHSFVLPAGATLMELADRVDDLTAIHECPPIAIQIDFGASHARGSMESSHRSYH